jgi:cytochrome b
MTTTTARIRIWDLPTRLFHWTLVICITGSFISVKVGGLWMDWHVRFGLITLWLIIFRLIWGVAGSRYARFNQFVRSPRTVWNYLRGRIPHIAGHNPLGAYSVIALLLSIGFQAFSGLFANDDVLTAGPLASLDESWSATLTGLHKLNEWVLIGLVSLHIAAILWYRIKRRKNLVAAMIHGNAQMNALTGQSVPGAQDSWKMRLKALALATAAGLAVWWLTTLAPAADSFY